MLIIPKTLAQNAGLDPQEVIVKLQVNKTLLYEERRL